MSADLKIESYLPDLPGPGCCPNKVYALIFNHAGKALDKIGSVYGFLDFTSIAVDGFKIPLSENAQRTWYYSSADIPAAELASVPITPADEPYWLEYWLQAGSSASRILDTLQKTERFWWLGGRMVFSSLSDYDRSLLTYQKSHVTVGYDTAAGKLRFIAWLDRGGQLVTNPLSCEVKWLKRDGSTIAHFNLISTMPQMPGVFQTEQAIVDLDPDEATPVKVTIINADGTASVSEHGITSWD